MENYLNAPIQGLLEASLVPLSVYQIIEDMKRLGYLLDYDLSNVEHLFAVNFLVNNALYALQLSYAEQSGLYLSISSLAVQLKQPADNSSLPDLAHPSDIHLRKYYGSWDNLEAANKESVDALLTSFWQQFVTDDEYFQALTLFDLRAGCDINQVKKQYRKLAMQQHPDRGGTAADFQALNHAMAVLQKRLKSSN